MSGSLKMYRLKPIVNQCESISVSKCMYKMKNIHDVNNQTINHVSNTSSMETLPEMEALEKRQEIILAQLEQLKNQMQNLRLELKLCNKPGSDTVPKSIVKTASSVNVNNLSDIVIKVSPDHVPYSLLVLQNLWKKSLHLSFEIHVHSSVTNLPECASSFCSQLKSPKLDSSLPQLNVTLIWKKMDADIELMTSSSSISISGESNVSRYMSRIGPSDFNYENESNPTLIDNILDLCYCLSRTKLKGEKQTYIRNLNAKLGKSVWLAGKEQIGIADVTAYSTIKQINASNEITINMTKWMNRIEELL